MAPPTLVVFSRQGLSSLPATTRSRLNEVADVYFAKMPSAPGRQEAVRLLAEADLLGATNACLPAIDAGLLDAVPRLRGIVLYATGYDHLDTELLSSRGVGLSVLPGYATVAVSEHAMAMMMALASRLHLANDRSRGIAPGGVSLRGVELAGRTLGVIGVGRIGLRFAMLARALGMTVVGTDPDPDAVHRARLSGLDMVTLGELLAAADVVSVCASQCFGAGPILSTTELAALRPGALLVNAARASLVDTAAAIAAIRQGHLRGYAVDDEVGDRIAHADVLREGRLLQTGHSAWWRDEVLHRGASLWGEALVAAAIGEPVDTVTWPATAIHTTCAGVG